MIHLMTVVVATAAPLFIMAALVVRTERLKAALAHEEAWSKYLYKSRKDVLAALDNARADLRRQEETVRQAVQLERSHFNRERAQLLAQNVGMADRLAALKLRTVTDDGDPVVEDGDPVPYEIMDPDNRPYLAALDEFLKAIEFEEARTTCEEFVAAKRGAGLADEQILTKLRNGEYT